MCDHLVRSVSPSEPSPWGAVYLRQDMSVLPKSPISLYRPKALQEIVFVGAAYFVYSQVRGLAGDRVVDAFGNGRRVVQLEQDLGIFQELALQGYVFRTTCCSTYST